jgi:hypothetical protein
MKRPFLLILLTCLLTPSFSQIHIRGKVLSQSSNKIIPFANIGILDSPIGSISNEDGSFFLSIPNSYLDHFLTVSSVGYSRWNIPISKIDTSETYTVFLQESSTRIQEVLVEAKKERNRNFWLGNKRSDSGIIYADSVVAGSAVALLIENTQTKYDLSIPVYLEAASVYIFHNSMNDFKVRVRVVKVDSANNNLPGEDLLDKSIVVESNKTSGWIDIDLSQYNFKISAPFFLMFEWIMDATDRLELYNIYKQYRELYPEKVRIDSSRIRGEQVTFYNLGGFTGGTLFGASTKQSVRDNFSCYYRMNSFGKWKVAPAALTARLLVSTTGQSNNLISVYQHLSESIKTALDEFRNSRPIEKVYIYTDKYAYATGDTIWLKTYVVDGSYHQFFNGSSVLHVELINPKSEILKRSKLHVTNGYATGDFVLADTMVSGTYCLRAYTNNMRNDHQDYFFKKNLVIENPEMAENLEPPKNNDSLMVRFFPEGGTFINDMRNRVAFKITNKLGIGVDGIVSIVNGSGEQVTSQKTSHHGMGSFTMTPENGQMYFANITTSIGEVLRFPLPIRSDTGVRMMINNLQNSQVVVNLQSSPDINDVLITATCRNVLVYSGNAQMRKGGVNLTIPRSDLPKGIIQITVFSENGVPLAERLVFNKINNQSSIEMTSDKDVYHQREQVNLSIKLDASDISNTSGNFSLSVSDIKQDIRDPGEHSIVTNLLLTSDLRGYIEQPGMYFRDDLMESRLRLDLLMMVHGWRRFTWKEVLEKTYATPGYNFESGITVRGTIKRAYSNKSVESGNVMMFVSSDSLDSEFFISAIGPNGDFTFHPMQIYENMNLIVQAEDKKERKDLLVEIKPRVYPPFNTVIFQNFDLDENKSYRLKESRYRMDLADSVTLMDSIVVEAKRTKSEGFPRIPSIYGEPDKTLKPSEIIGSDVYQDVFLLLRGRVAGLFVSYDVVSPGVSIRGKGSPLYLLDQVQVRPQVLLGIPVRDIESVDIIKGPRAAIFGQKGANGIIAVNTKRGPSSRSEPSYVVNLSNIGYQVVKEFYSPVYSDAKNLRSKPDLRSTLYWNPDIIIDSGGEVNLSFYAADYDTEYRIKMEGLTNHGEPLTFESTFSVSGTAD